jgi:hypothetical protein
MLGKCLTDIWVVNEDEVFKLETDFKESVNLALHLPLDQLLSDGGAWAADGIHARGKHKSLLIVPDHWMGNQSLAFRSQKPGLIDPFLRRKLSSVHPDKRNVINFFDYQLPKNQRKSNNLYAYYMQDEKGFALYDMLDEHHMAPQRIISPAFLWQYWLKRQADIEEGNYCLLHFFGHDCALYFFHDGNFLFSRRVRLSKDAECWSVLTHEINQSLYLYAQKTKADLKQIYWHASEAMAGPPSVELPERELIALDFDATKTGISIHISELAFLDGMISERLTLFKTDVMGITHRQVKKYLEWRPVWRLGMILGGVLIALMIAEDVWLGKLLEEERFKRKYISEAANPSSAAGREDYTQALDDLLSTAARPSPAQLILKLASTLPPRILISGLEIQSQNSPQLKLSATVDALDVNHFRMILNELVHKMNDAFQTSPALTFKDIDFQLKNTEAADGYQRYLINFRIQLV